MIPNDSKGSTRGSIFGTKFDFARAETGINSHEPANEITTSLLSDK